MAVQNAKKQNGARPAARPDRRTHSVVYHKSDARVNTIIRRYRKSDIINLYNVDCCMLFRVDDAHMQFDPLQNYRPYILFYGSAEGVFLPEKLNLLFPNRCDQLDFRPDYPVPVELTYALSDTEIAVMAGNGLFNSDWSCQGRVIDSILEIPCRIDYHAVSRTPITFIEIQDRLAMHTSTKQTGYKTLVSAFLPYSAQKHNIGQKAEIVPLPETDAASLDIRKRLDHEERPVGFGTEEENRAVAGGASFVEIAQARIRERLKKSMDDADVLGIKSGIDPDKKGEAVADSVVAAVKAVQERTSEERERLLGEADQRGIQTKPSDVDARLNDMASRMIFAGAAQIPVERPKLQAEPLVTGSGDGIKPGTMDEPFPKQHKDLSDGDKVMLHDDRIHKAAGDARATASDITSKVKSAKSRAEILAARRAARSGEKADTGTPDDKIAEAMSQAGKIRPEDGKPLEAPAGTPAEPGKPPEAPAAPRSASASSKPGGLDGDILTQDIPIDKVLKGFGL